MGVMHLHSSYKPDRCLPLCGFLLFIEPTLFGCIFFTKGHGMFTHFFKRRNFQRCISKYHLLLVCLFMYFSACHEIVCGNDIQTQAKVISLKEAIDIALERNP